MKPPGQPPDRRLEPRTTQVSNYRAEFKFSGVPVYQLKLRDLSTKGAGIVARADSKFLKMIQNGQELDFKLILFSKDAGRPGHYRARIEHISELNGGRFRGHKVVGLSILSKVS